MNRFGRGALKCVAVFLATTAAVCSHAAVPLTGVNLAGADFGESVLPGVYNTHYTYPNNAEVDYYLDKGVNLFRLPFRWERLQRSLNSPLDTTEFGRLDAVVEYATSQGAQVILDPHNYARYHGDVIGGGQVSDADFADFWSRLADEYKDNDRVIFGLVNEPNTMPTEQWLSAANAAIGSIRDSGAENLILVPGNAWSGAHSWTQNWYGTPNAQVMLGVVDPADNFAFDVHQYLNGNSSGADSEIVSQTIGRDRLVAFTNWAQQNGMKAVLGEFAVANSTVGDAANQIGDEAINLMLDYMDANDDVWLGWTWWAGGPWWGEYRFTIEPRNLSSGNPIDRPVMDLLEPRFTGIPSVAAGDSNGDGVINTLDIDPFVQALTDPSGYAAAFPEVDFLAANDVNMDGVVSTLDIDPFVALLTGGGSAAPEPASSALLALCVALSLLRRPRE